MGDHSDQSVGAKVGAELVAPCVARRPPPYPAAPVNVKSVTKTSDVRHIHGHK